jgi:hypothetical protein
MKRREFLAGLAAAAAGPLVFGRRATAQATEARLARLAIMSLSFSSVLKTPGAADSPARTVDVMDIGQMYADRYGIHFVELQHAYLPSTEPGWLKDFRARLARTKSRVSNINLEFGAAMTMSADAPVGRLHAIDLTKRWIDHAAMLGCPRVMLNQGALTDENKQTAISVLRIMSDYGRTKGVMVSLEPRGAGGGRRGGAGDAPSPPPQGPPPPPPYLLLTEVIRSAGAYANVDVANFGDQPVQQAGIRAMMPHTVGNTHVRLNPARYDLAAALAIIRDEFKYRGIYSIEAGIPAGPDPYANIQEIRDFALAHV